MSDKTLFAHGVALQVAKDIQAMLSPSCNRIAIAGSLRRGKPWVGDIEILFVPKMSTRPDGLFDQRIVSVADEVLEQLLRDGVFSKRPNKNGIFAWGQSNKLAVHVASRIPVDFFSTTEEKWWVSLVIRTGGKDTNLMLTNGAIKRNCTLHAYGSGITNLRTGELEDAVSEQDVFDMCGVPYAEPEQRR